MFESGNEAKISPEALAHWPKSEIECNHLRERERELVAHNNRERPGKFDTAVRAASEPCRRRFSLSLSL